MPHSSELIPAPPLLLIFWKISYFLLELLKYITSPEYFSNPSISANSYTPSTNSSYSIVLELFLSSALKASFLTLYLASSFSYNLTQTFNHSLSSFICFNSYSMFSFETDGLKSTCLTSLFGAIYDGYFCY